MSHEMLGGERAILRRALRKNLSTKAIGGDIFWEFDIPYHRTGQDEDYDRAFKTLLLHEGTTSFQQWVVQRKGRGLSTNILDCFGSAYFLSDPSVADSLTGVRLADNSDERLTYLSEWLPKMSVTDSEYERYNNALVRLQTVKRATNWKIVEGNLFQGKTWRTVDSANGDMQYDLIVAKPEIAFGERDTFDRQDSLEWPVNEAISRIYGSIFLRLLDRGYARLNPNEGVLMMQVPNFIVHGYLESFAKVLQTHGGITATIMDTKEELCKANLSLVRHKNSTNSLEGLIRKHPPQWSF